MASSYHESFNDVFITSDALLVGIATDDTGWTIPTLSPGSTITLDASCSFQIPKLGSMAQWERVVQTKELKDWTVEELEYALKFNPKEELEKDQDLNLFASVEVEIESGGAKKITVSPYLIDKVEHVRRWVDENRLLLEGALALRRLKR